MNENLDDNPLLVRDGLPLFDRITPEHVVPAMRRVIAETEALVSELERNLEPTWGGLLKPLEDMDVAWEYSWGAVNHLLGVRNSEDLRKVHAEVLPEVVDLSLRISQSEMLYQGLVALRDSAEWQTLNEGRRRIVAKKILSAELAGVALTGESRQRFAEIARELSQLSTDFSDHVLDATKAFELIVTDPGDTAGWPETLKHLSAQSYNTAGAERGADPENGPWRITLDFPCFQPFMQHSRNRSQREQVYRAFMRRASAEPTDNTVLVERILALRHEKAQLLGYSSYAELSLATKMASGVAEIETMFAELYAAARPHAEQDLAELSRYAAEHGFEGELEHWDITFWSERLREERYNYTDDELRPYFPLEEVLKGLFGLTRRLLAVDMIPADGQAPVWHPDVRFFTVHENGRQVASFYLDPYSRPAEKRGGAWMDECLSRRWLEGELRLPVVHLCCNSTPPAGNRPSLMSFQEVETLFHEFGHGLQAMLSRVDDAAAAGINGVEWDAVELPSQFMENWCFHKNTLIGLSRHHVTGQRLPDELFEKILSARNYRSGSQILRQLEFSMTDMDLHGRYVPGGSENAFDVHRRIAERINVMPPFADNRFLCSFSHIFAGGYAAGYYSYKYAEVLSADVFAAFEEAGLDDAAAVRRTGSRYRETILALGGSRHPMDVFRDFRGREPKTEPLLRHSGLAANRTGAQEWN